MSKDTINNQLILEKVTTQVGVLANSQLYADEPNLQELVAAFRKDEKRKKLSITELKLYASDFNYWMDILNQMQHQHTTSQSTKTQLLNDFRVGLKQDLAELNNEDFYITEEELNVIIDFATGQCQNALEKLTE